MHSVRPSCFAIIWNYGSTPTSAYYVTHLAILFGLFGIILLFGQSIILVHNGITHGSIVIRCRYVNV